MRIELSPTAKLVGIALLALGLLALAIYQGPDARRYVKMEEM